MSKDRKQMQCPVCANVQLVMSERSGIEIDYCPQCRGVWLDRGELDKIIDRAAPQSVAVPVPPPAQQPAYRDERHRDDRAPYPPQQGYYRKKKREGFLGELFDFD
jgi:Zn-finger nucleic acid-binding protein